MHELTKKNIEHRNAKYKLVGDKARKHVVFAPGVIEAKVSRLSMR